MRRSISLSLVLLFTVANGCDSNPTAPSAPNPADFPAVAGSVGQGTSPPPLGKMEKPAATPKKGR